MTDTILCACGCGTPIPPMAKSGHTRTFAHGHNRRRIGMPRDQRRRRTATPRPADTQPRTVPCACGCGTLLPAINRLGQPSTYARGHHWRGHPKSEATRQKIRATKKRFYDAQGRSPAAWERYKDPRYAAWRDAVLTRDDNTCQDCGQHGHPDEKGFAAHHLKPYATYPALRLDVSNGVTLCRVCHMARHGIVVEPKRQVPCACGCGTLIWNKSREGQPRRYVNGHTHRGRPKTEAEKQANRLAHLGKKASPETRAKQSVRQKGKPVPAAMQAASIATNTGKKRPDMAAYNRARVWTEEMRARMSETKRGTTISDEARTTQSAALEGKPKSPEHRAALTKARHERIDRT
ncbi:MAG: HNH endonuclease [Chloroflexota bacterium]|nr:HNH endonuclease [Chloroflexota bacterium]